FVPGRKCAEGHPARCRSGNEPSRAAQVRRSKLDGLLDRKPGAFSDSAARWIRLEPARKIPDRSRGSDKSGFPKSHARDRSCPDSRPKRQDRLRDAREEVAEGARALG